MFKLVLASSSPRRRMLLESAGVSVVVRPPRCDESRRRGEPAIDYARRVAEEKLRAVLAGLDDHDHDRGAVPEGRVVLAADTVVWTDPGETIFGKPSDVADARRMLAALATGRPHCVTTAWALGSGAADVEVHATTTRVFMRQPATSELEAYLQTDEWSDKAGGYAIQGRAAGWIGRIEGSYTNVVGLPLCAVLERLLTSQRARR